MARSRKVATAESSDRLPEALKALTGQVQQLSLTVLQLVEVSSLLRDKLSTLCMVADELLTELQWRNDRVAGTGQKRSFRLVSMPADPAAENWPNNGATPESSSIPTPSVSRSRTQKLFD